MEVKAALHFLVEMVLVAVLTAQEVMVLLILAAVVVAQERLEHLLLKVVAVLVHIVKNLLTHHLQPIHTLLEQVEAEVQQEQADLLAGLVAPV